MRDFDERWIRIDCRKGDMIVLPEGIYHRFTLDTNNYIKVRVLRSPAKSQRAGNLGCRIQSQSPRLEPHSPSIPV